MSYAIDPELLPSLSMLPVVIDYSDLAALRTQLTAMVRGAQHYTPTNRIEVEDCQIPGPTDART